MVAVWASAEPDAARGCARRRRRSRFSRPSTSSIAAHADSPLPTRVGLESGEMLLGNIGAEQRYEYRAVGDIVNTASRIQGLESAARHARADFGGDAGRACDLPARDVGTFLLRGKRLPVRVLEPLDGARHARSTTRVSRRLRAALAAFRRGAWQDAHEGFAAARGAFPGRRPEPLLRRR